MTESGISRLLTVSRDSAGDVTVVSAAGEIDILSAAALREALDEVTADHDLPVIDLSAVEFMGSVGLSVLLELADRVRPQRVRVVVSKHVRRPIEVTGLDKLLVLYDSLPEALGR
ncbi:STAS domain-containing protein [Nocardia yunnanensis]|uniref:STAS domain-containing protein n=1 Tax=Nocardia yunnanensis TaxID=2382165 RepID=UPI001FE55166|nr:STAS domain-containing protein [Nocardia yunnanensis]